MTKSDLENLVVGTRQDIWSRFGHFNIMHEKVKKITQV